MRSLVLGVVVVAGAACALLAFASAAFFFAAAGDNGYSEGTPERLGAACVMGGLVALVASLLAARSLLRSKS